MISTSTSKSGSNWLDRLRSSRGFPTGDEPDLDRFLSSSSSSCTSNSTARPESTQFTRRRVNSDFPKKDKNVAGNFSEVLSDLFNMGECSRTFSKKNCRKQSNPRFFDSPNLVRTNPILLNSPNLEVVNNDSPSLEKETNDSNPRLFNSDDLCSSDDLRREKSENLIVSSGDNSLNDKNCNDKLGISNKVNDEVRNDNGEEEEEEVFDMKEYTRSEVTVIDTSFEEWKSDKWVFRKKDEWKIKDKKLNSKKKKRKLLLVDDDSELEKRVVESCDFDGDMLKEKKIMQLNKPKNDKATELLKEAAEFVGKVSQSRFPCPRPPEKVRIESAPVILLKPIPSSNNANGIIRLGKSAKKGFPKKFKII